MNFPAFAGNRHIKDRLSSGPFSHAYILSGPSGSGKKTLARILAAAMMCENGKDIPCMKCANCRKIFSGEHPDLYILSPAESKRAVSVDAVRAMRLDAFVRPNEAEKKVFVIEDADLLNASSQNALLKILEEPPAFTAFILLCKNPESLLVTVRSRCVELELRPLTQDELLPILRARFPAASDGDLKEAAGVSGGFVGQAMDALDGQKSEAAEKVSLMFSALEKKDPAALAVLAVSMEKTERLLLSAVLELAFKESEIRLKQACFAPAVFTEQELSALCRLFDKLAEFARQNVSSGHIMGYFTARCREIFSL